MSAACESHFLWVLQKKYAQQDDVSLTMFNLCQCVWRGTWSDNKGLGQRKESAQWRGTVHHLSNNLLCGWLPASCQPPIKNLIKLRRRTHECIWRLNLTYLEDTHRIEKEHWLSMIPSGVSYWAAAGRHVSHGEHFYPVSLSYYWITTSDLRTEVSMIPVGYHTRVSNAPVFEKDGELVVKSRHFHYEIFNCVDPRILSG